MTVRAEGEYSIAGGYAASNAILSFLCYAVIGNEVKQSNSCPIHNVKKT